MPFTPDGWLKQDAAEAAGAVDRLLSGVDQPGVYRTASHCGGLPWRPQGA